MCMKNVNINSFICQSIIGEKSNAPSFLGVSDIVAGSLTSEGIIVDSFSIGILVDIIQAIDEQEFFNNYECSLRITSFKGNTAEIARFRLSEDMTVIYQEEGIICRTFGTNKFYVTLNDFNFPDGSGRYIVKILIRKRDSESDMIIENDTQCMIPLYVVEKNN